MHSEVSEQALDKTRSQCVCVCDVNAAETEVHVFINSCEPLDSERSSE